MEHKISIKARLACTEAELIGEKERLAYLLEQHGFSVDFIEITKGEKQWNE